jgi:Polyketide cyclase / dehydrase and lipid transport.
MPRYVAERTLLAPVEDVWAFLVEPYHLPDWWPGLGGVQPDRRGVAPGARWTILGSSALSEESLRPIFGPGMFRRPDAAGTLLVLDVVRGRRLAFQLVNENITAELDLSPADGDRTAVTLTVEASWGAVRRSYAKDALGRLYDLVQTGDTT